MNDRGLTCREDRRHELVRTADLYGVDYVEVISDDQRTLRVVFLGKAPARDKIAKENVRIDGGRRVPDVRVDAIDLHYQNDPALDDAVEVTVQEPGDFSTYTLRFVTRDAEGYPTDEPMDGFDPRYASVEFSFKPGCPSDLDCRPITSCPPPERPQPSIDYLAKDYESFRRLIYDRLALTLPDWRDRHVPDVGVALVELLAYVGDYLSYHQDAVATEAYIGTARQRISVRRHARLVDYVMHEGCNARAWVTLTTKATQESLQFDQIFFVTAFPGAPRNRYVLHKDEVPTDNPGRPLLFEPVSISPEATKLEIYGAHGEMHLYTWGNEECCLTVGATAATLVDPASGGIRPDPVKGEGYDLQLHVGDVIVFEEVIGPRTGTPADADPRHRQAVRLTTVTYTVDPLGDTPLVEVEWNSDDALTFPLCLSSRADDCRLLAQVSVARGNVVLVDHGECIKETLGDVQAASSHPRCPTECDPGEIIVVPAPFRPSLTGTPLTYAQPIPRCASARELEVQDPRRARPAIMLTGRRPGVDDVEPWEACADLFDSGSDDRHFVAEIDNRGVAHLRFGDGRLGRQPDVGTEFDAHYRVGNGFAGNVGAERISYLVHRKTRSSGSTITVRNPLPATGGSDPESVADVKRMAPSAFRKTLQRAVTADDYATLARDNARRRLERAARLAATDPAHPCPPPFRELQQAKARLRWTGAWYEVLVAIDPRGTEDVDAQLLQEIESYLEPYRRVGHEVVVGAATYVAVDLALRVCVSTRSVRGHVEAALRDAFSNRILPNGNRGFFHPDAWTFDDDVPVSTIVAAAQAAPGVESVQVTRLRRYQVGTPAQRPQEPPQLPSGGILRLGPFEIARMSSDPSFPEHGRLTLEMCGGR